MSRHLLIYVTAIAFAIAPLAHSALAQDSQTSYGKHKITSTEPKVMASEEEPLPKAKKSSGKYVLWTALGVALVAMAAGGAGGGDSGSNPPPGDTGSVEVGW